MMKLGVMAAVSVMAAVAAGRDTAIYSGKLTSAMNANQFAITNLATPVAAGDAVNKGYVDSIGGVTPSAVTGVVTGVVADWALKPNERPEGMSTNTVAWIVTNEVERTIGGVYSVSNTPAGTAINASAYGDPTWDGSQWVMYGSSTIPDFTQWRDPWDGENDIPTRWTYDDTYSDVYLIGFIGGATVVKENALGMASTNYVASYVASHTSPLDTQAVTNIVEGYNYVTASVTNGLAGEAYVDAAVAGATPANYAAVSNAAIYASNRVDQATEGIAFTNDVPFILASYVPEEGYEDTTCNLLGQYYDNDVGSWMFNIAITNRSVKGASWYQGFGSSREDTNVSFMTDIGGVFLMTFTFTRPAAYEIKPTIKRYVDENFATDARVTAVSNRVDAWETYWRGDRVRLSVTNYYGNSTGEPPRLRIEESETNGVGEIIGYRIVWDEVTRQTNYQQQVDVKLNDISNNVMMATFRQTNNQLANKAPRAWGTVTSSGESAPANTVWHTAPNTVFAGGTEYAHVAVGEGSICVLVDKGAGVFTEGEAGQFRFKDESGENYFGFDVRESYTLGCRTDGISVTTVGGNKIITLTYDVTSASDPEIMTCSDLLAANWSEVTEVEWEQNPPAGCKICYINAGPAPTGFYKAQMTYPGGSKFVTNMQADLQGGITATNEALNVWQSVYPVITATGIVWRVKQ